MRDKPSARAAIFIFGIPTLITSALGIFVWNASARAERPAAAATDARAAEISLRSAGNGVFEDVGPPSRIRIPRIRVDAAVEAVSVDAGGFMGAPKRPSDVAWYEPGSRPGEAGSAVIAGHVDWYGGATAAFAKLDRLKAGDTIIISDDSGEERSFVVREKRKYDASADATDVFSSSDGKAHLNLVTCSGSWKKSAKQYSKRLVVFADRKN